MDEQMLAIQEKKANFKNLMNASAINKFNQEIKIL